MRTDLPPTARSPERSGLRMHRVTPAPAPRADLLTLALSRQDSCLFSSDPCWNVAYAMTDLLLGEWDTYLFFSQ